MILRFKDAVARSSEIGCAQLTTVRTGTTRKWTSYPILHIDFMYGNKWLEIYYDSLEEAEEGLEQVVKAMEIDERSTKPKKKVPCRKIR